MSRLDAAVLDAPVVGRNLTGASFGAELEDEPTLVVLLRHPG
ncbi:MAG: hypothetical protein AAGA99_12640 [Actinomycetota bacterium]